MKTLKLYFYFKSVARCPVWLGVIFEVIVPQISIKQKAKVNRKNNLWGLCFDFFFFFFLHRDFLYSPGFPGTHWRLALRLTCLFPSWVLGLRACKSRWAIICVFKNSLSYRFNLPNSGCQNDHLLCFYFKSLLWKKKESVLKNCSFYFLMFGYIRVAYKCLVVVY